MGFSIAPDDVAKYIPLFRSLPVWWQLVIVLAVAVLISGWVGWRLGSGLYTERLNIYQATIDQLKGLSPSEALDKIGRLEAMVVELQRQQWRKITAIQREQFISNLQKVEALKNAFVEIFVVVGDTEAENNARELSRLLRDVGFNTGYGSIRRDPEWQQLDKFGLVVLVKDAGGPLYSNALWLMRGFEWSGIDCHLSSEGVVPHARVDYLALRIGPKPE